MKKFQILFLALFLGAVSVTFNSCTKDDPCKDVTCGDHGSCFEGSCVCDEGYELGADTKCSAEIRAKTIGSYTFSDVCSTGTYTGTATIENSSAGVFNIVVGNFAGSGTTVKVTATMDKNNKITIPDGALGSFTVSSASGTFASGKISWTYSLKDTAGAVDVCTSTWTKL